MTLGNRLGKSALTEGLGDEYNRATARHERLYEQWSRGGTGLLFTGNIQVDRRYLERSGNVAVDGNGGLKELAAFAKAATIAGNHAWAQIGHAGRQVTKFTNPTPVGPSAIALDLPGDGFGVPRELSGDEIKDVINRFVIASTACIKAGFTGVQLHAAHGYLISSFLSPKANKRTDEWGGSLENRARLLLETIHAVRKAVGASVPIGVKLNSSDFQKDGFTAEECLQVVAWLEDAGIDLLELSGGNYESPAMMQKARESTVKREAYFLEHAAMVRKATSLPVMVTGGFRTAQGMAEAITNGACDVIGMGRPLCVDPACSSKLLNGAAMVDGREDQTTAVPRGNMWYYYQLYRLGDGLDVDLSKDIKEAVRACFGIEVAAAEALTGRDVSFGDAA